LSDLSCRFTISPAARGVILSVLVVPRGEDPRFAELVREVVEMATAVEGGGRPITLATLGTPWPGEAIQLETIASTRPGRSRFTRRLAVIAQFCLGIAFRAAKFKTKDFDAAVYTSDVAANADFRKFDDGLRMTLDCSPKFADALEARLNAAADIAHHGTFRQESALLTCFVPSITDRGHVHFVDGAGGGYAMAAQALKARLAVSRAEK
jgi:hypothetical protein